MSEIEIGSLYQDKRNRGGEPRYVQVVDLHHNLVTGEQFATLKNVKTLRRVNVKRKRLSDPSRFTLVAKDSALFTDNPPCPV